MNKLRLLALTSVLLASGLMTSCFEDTTSSSAPTISSFESASFTEGTDTLGANTKLEFYGKVSDDQGLKSWALEVLNSAGTVVYTATVPTISGTSVSFDLPSKSSVNLSVTNDGKWGATGQYTVRLTVTNTQGNSIKAEQKIFAKGSAQTTPLAAQGVLNVGGTSAAPPSFIGLGTNPAMAYSSSQTTTNFASIDLVITNAAGTTTAILESTAAGVADATLQATYWAGGRGTLIQDIGTAVPATKEAAIAALTGTNQSANIVNGHTYVAKTVEGVYAVLTASSVSGTGSSVTLTVTVLK